LPRPPECEKGETSEDTEMILIGRTSGDCKANLPCPTIATTYNHDNVKTMG